MTLMFFIAFGLSLAFTYYEFGFKENIETSSASSSDNVNSWAWNSNIGWISFNCTNDSPACGSSNYGVNVDLVTGYFTGYAWSSNVGWVSFNRRTCVGGSDAGMYCTANNNCSSNSCRLDGPGAAGTPPGSPYNSPASLTYNAAYNFSTYAVTGWGKILSMGENGWIKMSDDSVPAWNGKGVKINQATGDFSGWAWNANDDKSGIGWISFNCINDSSCSASNYKVVADVNRAPGATALNAPNWSFSEAGQFGSLKAKLGWTFSDQDAGQSEYAYQIIIDDDNNPADPLFDSGQCFNYNIPTSKCKIDVNNVNQFLINSSDMALNYNTPYYWWVKVWDSGPGHKDSGYVQYNTAKDTDNNDGVPLTFTTYKHEMPISGFTYFPNNPSRKEEVKFTNISQVYLSSDPNHAVGCSSDRCAYLWTVTAGASINDSATTSPIITFNSADNPTVTLKVIDNDGYYISSSQVINVNAQLPKWKEVKPE